VESDGKPPLVQSASTAAGIGRAFAGTVNEPCHDPFDATGAWNATPSVVAETLTKSVPGEERRPGAQPVPLTCTTVPGAPDWGDTVNDVIAAWAAPAVNTTPAIATAALTTIEARAWPAVTAWGRPGRAGLFIGQYLRMSRVATRSAPGCTS